MSDLAEKLADPVRSRGDKAQATRKQLLARYGVQLGAHLVDAKTILIDTMGGREVWRHVSGDIFEQVVRS